MIGRRHVRLASRFLRHRFAALHPYEVQAALLTACNLRCDYCRWPDVKTDLLSTAQWVAVIRGLADVGTLRIKFQGGEPTLRTDFLELCTAARERGLLTAVITNGSVVARRPALLAHLDEIVVSLDAATPALHDRVRGRGSHADAVAAIELARARGLRTYVNMVVTRDTLAEVERVLAFCEARGVGLNAQPVAFENRYYDEGARHLGLAAEETAALNRRLASWRRAGRHVMFTAATYERIAAWPDPASATRRGPHPSPCMAGRFYVHIEPNGDVLPCVQHGGVFTPKNAVRDGLAAALRNAREHDCADCAFGYLVERKALFALRPSALAAVARRG